MATERPDLERTHERLEREFVQHERRLASAEEAILDSLASSDGGAILGGCRW